MKFGVREICDIVLKAKSDVVIGNTSFKKDEPVMYFDSAKTSTIEGAATTVYATGGRGNARLIAWEGERTVTFTFEDALMSPLGFSILSGAGIVDAAASSGALNVHTTTKMVGTITSNTMTIDLNNYLPKGSKMNAEAGVYGFILDASGNIVKRMGKVIPSGGTGTNTQCVFNSLATGNGDYTILLDYYVKAEGGVQQIEITPDKFAGNYYLEAETLFRRQEDGVDMPAQFIIPNVKIQSNFNFSMAASGDPSTFTFTMDAFPDYTRFDKKKKVLFALQILDLQKGLASAPPSPEVANVMGDEMMGRRVK